MENLKFSPKNYKGLGKLDQPEWLWPGWLMRGAITLLVGPAAIGKSKFSRDLARRIENNLFAPDGQEFQPRTGVVIWGSNFVVDTLNKPDLIIVEDLIAPANTKQLHKTLLTLEMLAKEFDCALLLHDYPKKSSESEGAISLDDLRHTETTAKARTIISLQRDGNGLRLAQIKNNRAARPPIEMSIKSDKIIYTVTV